MALWIDEAVRGSFARERLAAALQRLEAAWPEPLPRLEHLVSDLPFPQAALFHLLAISPASVKRLVKNPDALVWLSKTGALAEERNLRKLRGAWGRFVEQAPGPVIRKPAPMCLLIPHSVPYGALSSGKCCG
jgi:hypothetical protein